MFQNKLHMLQNSIPPITPDERQYVVGEQQGLDQLVEWGIGFLRRQYWVVLFVAALGIGLGLVFLSIATPIYTAQTSVYIDLHRSSPGQEGIFGNDPIEIESQMEIVKSKAIALSVIKKLGLANSPDFELSRGLISELWDSRSAALPSLRHLTQPVWIDWPERSSGILLSNEFPGAE